MPGQLVVQFEPGAGASARAQLRRTADVTVVRALREPGQQLLEVRDGGSVASVVRSLEADPRVVYAEPNYLYRAAAVPNDPAFGQLWGLGNTGQAVNGEPGGVAGADIDATSAWDLTTGSANVVVAVADTGIEYDHPDIAGNMSPLLGRDFIDGDADPRDLNGHGTHVAGTIAAVGNNGVGTTGVSWDASLVAVRVLDASGTGNLSSVASGFDYAGDLGVDVVNASLSGGAFSNAIEATIASHPRTLFVVAAGNDGLDNESTPSFPCNYTAANLICVAATTQSDGLASFSNIGATSVDLGAPGASILSTVPGGGYEFISGTSMATPHVAGAAALIRAALPTAPVPRLRSALLSSGDPLPALAGTTVTGRRLNAYAALLAGGASPAPAPPVEEDVPDEPLETLESDLPAESFSRSRLGRVRARCRVAGGRRIVCRLQRGSTVTRATLRLRRGGRTIARRSLKPKGAGKLAFRAPRKLKPGRYVVRLALRDAAGHKRTLRRTVRV